MNKTFKLSWLRFLLVVPALLSLLVMAGVFNAPVAHAGSNGQQYALVCVNGTNLDNRTVKVVGDNQDNNFVTWTGNPQYPNKVVTYGWWWNNTVYVYYYVNGVYQHHSVSVPKSQSGDIFYDNVNC